MLRLAGAVMICAVCIMYGFGAADRLRRRRDFLNAFASSLAVLEAEITFGKYRLASAFERLGDNKALCGLYENAAKNIGGMGIREAWEIAARCAADCAGLCREEAETVLSLGTELGMTDIDGQQKLIKHTAGIIAGYAASAAEQYTRLARPYRGCGILAGIFIIIIFM